MGNDVTVRELAVPGAWEITPRLHHDDRGLFYEWMTSEQLHAVAGHRFDLRQANCSVSAAGVLRGVHFAQVPPGQAKYVTVPRGAIYDVVVDLRVGSPTFGQWDWLLLNDRNRRSLYVSEGLGHAFLSLEDDSTVLYLTSAEYNPDREHGILATDPALGIEWPSVSEDGPQMSERDRTAPTLDEIRTAGVLPTWQETRAYVDRLRS